MSNSLEGTTDSQGPTLQYILHHNHQYTNLSHNYYHANPQHIYTPTTNTPITNTPITNTRTHHI